MGDSWHRLTFYNRYFPCNVPFRSILIPKLVEITDQSVRVANYNYI